MKVIVNSEYIEFKHWLYSVIISKQNNIYFEVFNKEAPFIVKVYSNNQEIKSSLGFLGNIFYFVLEAIGDSPTGIRYYKQVRKFLEDLKSNNYNIEEINKLEAVLNKPAPKESIMGTKNWQKDKFRLFLIIFIIFIIIPVMIGLLFGASLAFFWLMGIFAVIIIIVALLFIFLK